MDWAGQGWPSVLALLGEYPQLVGDPHLPNVLLLHFADLKSDMRYKIGEIATSSGSTYPTHVGR
jgi:hypothetical protein